MQAFLDFLTFKSFISYSMLFVFYYAGAIGVPFLVYTYTKKFYKLPKEAIDTLIPQEYKIKLFLLFIALFVFLEILWRMMFEFLIAFLQIRDVLIS